MADFIDSTTTKKATLVTCKCSYLPTLMVTDKGSVFIYQVLSEVTAKLDMALKHATTKHAQNVGVLETTHATIKTSLKVASGENRKQWQKHLPLATSNYKPSFQKNLGRDSTRVSHGRVPCNILDH